MNKIEIINLIKSKIIKEYTIENISSLSLEEFRIYIIDLFKLIYDNKDTYNLSYIDFRDFLNEFYFNIDVENINIQNRFILLVEEIALNYACEPYLWNSSFKEFKIKIIKDLNSGIY
jgi:hypothetical protein